MIKKCENYQKNDFGLLFFHSEIKYTKHTSFTNQYQKRQQIIINNLEKTKTLLINIIRRLSFTLIFQFKSKQLKVKQFLIQFNFQQIFSTKYGSEKIKNKRSRYKKIKTLIQYLKKQGAVGTCIQQSKNTPKIQTVNCVQNYNVNILIKHRITKIMMVQNSLEQYQQATDYQKKQQKVRSKHQRTKTNNKYICIHIQSMILL
eukprot:TRINITY_DN1199_c2_g1_i1.p1 TRINITY_DN1199_c2_g1~~TRINITY_DN1199_c2_g1_i1.p1  ORF type:complete len:202 (-),score=-15.15 TRINITY_DN1199_c2_g1_i1:79-684(-)